jgi:hypothetical protein
MERREKQSGGAGCAVGCLLVFLFLPVLYVLALGPAAYIADKFPATYDFIHIVYVPLGFLGKNCEPIQLAIDWYLGIWGY